MTLGLGLTVVFIVLKLTHVIDWSWWLVCLPEIIEVGIGLLWFLCVAAFGGTAYRKATRRF